MNTEVYFLLFQSAVYSRDIHSGTQIIGFHLLMRDLFQSCPGHEYSADRWVKREIRGSGRETFMGQAGKGTFSPYSIGQNSEEKSHLPATEARILHPALCPREGDELGNQ